MVGEVDGIKSRLPSKIFSTLKFSWNGFGSPEVKIRDSLGSFVFIFKKKVCSSWLQHGYSQKKLYESVQKAKRLHTKCIDFNNADNCFTRNICIQKVCAMYLQGVPSILHTSFKLLSIDEAILMRLLVDTRVRSDTKIHRNIP